MSINIKQMAREAFEKARKLEAADEAHFEDAIVDELMDLVNKTPKAEALEYVLANPKCLKDALTEGNCESTETLDQCVQGAMYRALADNLPTAFEEKEASH